MLERVGEKARERTEMSERERDQFPCIGFYLAIQVKNLPLIVLMRVTANLLK